MYVNEIYLCCTALDPRFKTALFSAESSAEVKEILTEKLAMVSTSKSDVNATESVSHNANPTSWWGEVS